MGQQLQDARGSAIGPLALARSATTWQVLDLGEIQVPYHPSGIGAQTVRIRAGGATGSVATPAASPAFHLNALLLLPLDIAAGIVVDDHVSSFTSFPDYNVEAHP
jgi:hypothetical protein